MTDLTDRAAQPAATSTAPRAPDGGRLGALPARVSSWGGLFLLYVVAGALLRPATWTTPFAYDTPYYLYEGTVVLGGGLPYLDVAENKGPLNAVVWALVDLVSFGSPLMVRVTLLLVAALTALAVTVYLARYAGRLAGVVAGIVVLVVLSAERFEALEPNTEQYGLVLAAAALCAAGWASRWGAAAAGVAMAAAVLVNPVFLAVAPFVLVELVVRHRGRVVVAIAHGVAGAVALGVVALAWLAAGGALSAMTDQLSGQAGRSSFSPANLVEPIRASGRVGLVEAVEVPGPGLWLVAVLGGLIALRVRRLRVPAAVALAWIAVMWLRVKGADYAFLHHYIPVAPALAVGVALGVAAVWPRDLPRRAGVAALVLVVPLWSYALAPQLRLVLLPADQRWGDLAAYPAIEPMADWIKANTDEDATVTVAGSPGVLWFADRDAPSRWLDSPPIDWWPAEAEAERRSDLLRDPPDAIGVAPGWELDPALAELLERDRYTLRYDPGNGARVWLRD